MGDVAMTYVCCPFENIMLVGITNGGGGTLNFTEKIRLQNALYQGKVNYTYVGTKRI